MKTRILQNEVKCLKCGDQIYSAHRHDFKYCSCENVFVDGGMDYIRRGYKDGGGVEDMSIVVEESVYSKVVEALDWAEENRRNRLGTVCAIFRAFRDCGYELKAKENNSE